MFEGVIVIRPYLSISLLAISFSGEGGDVRLASLSFKHIVDRSDTLVPSTLLCRWDTPLPLLFDDWSILARRTLLFNRSRFTGVFQ